VILVPGNHGETNGRRHTGGRHHEQFCRLHD
ncbi:hypothetical protein LTSEALA_3012, partial [Salmonella enterica subsp. enterica serovar Alachua str. R6-377]